MKKQGLDTPQSATDVKGPDQEDLLANSHREEVRARNQIPLATIPPAPSTGPDMVDSIYVW